MVNKNEGVQPEGFSIETFLLGEEPLKEESRPDQELEEINQMTMLQRVAAQIAGSIETKLSGQIDASIGSLSRKVEGLENQFKTALDAVPILIKEQIEGQIAANIKGISVEINRQFEEKIKALPGAQKLLAATEGKENGGGLGGISLSSVLQNPEGIISIINAFRSPTTEVAMMSQMNFVMKWHKILNQMEKGGGIGTDVTSAIADTFTQAPPE